MDTQTQPFGKPGAAVGFGLTGAALGLLLFATSGLDTLALVLPPLFACIVCLLASIGARASAGATILNVVLCGAVAAVAVVVVGIVVVAIIVFTAPSSQWQMG